MFRRRRSTDDFADEIQSHLALEADDLQSEGLSEDEARRRAGVAVWQRAENTGTLLSQKPYHMV